MPEPEEDAPLVSLGSGAVASPLIRTGVQLGAGQFLVEGLMLFNVVTLSADQEKWLGVALTLVVCGLQNVAERYAGRKLLGRTPQPAVAAPEG